MRSNLHLLGKLRFLSDKRRFELFPPYFLMRVKVVELTDDWSKVRIRLPLNWVSANAAGNMFGGYQASLADPVPALACLKRFPGFRFATKKLEINFIRVGNSDLMLHFDFSQQAEQAIRRQLEQHGHATPCFRMTFVRDDGQVCTEIKNTVAIRPKGYVGRHE
jgi:acyl-coenzyme A thioesterase PaaI-like protein